MSEDANTDDRFKEWFCKANLQRNPYYESLAPIITKEMRREIEERRSEYISNYNAAVQAGGGW